MFINITWCKNDYDEPQSWYKDRDLGDQYDQNYTLAYGLTLLSSLSHFPPLSLSPYKFVNFWW